MDPAATPQPSPERVYCKVHGEWIARFSAFLRVAGRAAQTRISYQHALQRYSAGLGDVLNPSATEIRAWVHARRRTLSERSFNNELSAVRTFYKWLHDMQFIARDLRPALPKMRRVPPRLPRTLTPLQVARLLAAPDTTTWIGFRDSVVLRLLYETGITAAECVRLTLGDLHDREIHVGSHHLRHGRFLPVSRELADMLQCWVHRRREVRPGKSAALFVTQRAAPFRVPRIIWTIVTRYARTALGLSRGYEVLERTRGRTPWGEFYPHLLRASFGAHLLESSGNLRAVQQMMGHATPNTTASYQQPDLRDLRTAIKKLRRPDAPPLKRPQRRAKR